MNPHQSKLPYTGPERDALSYPDANSPIACNEKKDSERSEGAQYPSPEWPDGRDWSLSKRHGRGARIARSLPAIANKTGSGLPG